MVIIIIFIIIVIIIIIIIIIIISIINARDVCMHFIFVLTSIFEMLIFVCCKKILCFRI